MPAKPARPVYLRNTLTWTLAVPLAAGGARYLPAQATTRVDSPTAAQPCVLAALAIEALVLVALPGAGRQAGSERLALRSPVSAALRHRLAFEAGMEGQVARRMAAERAAAAAGLDALHPSTRWTRQEWRADRAWRLEAERARRRLAAVKKHNAKIERQWDALRAAVAAAGRPIEALHAVLDREVPPPAGLNGFASVDMILPPKPDELATPPSQRTRKLRRMRRIASARRLIAAAAKASGRQDAMAWLAERLEIPAAAAPRERDPAGRWLAG
jgi:hypothetical protein